MAMVNTENELMDKIVTLCKRRGFVFQSWSNLRALF